MYLLIIWLAAVCGLIYLADPWSEKVSFAMLAVIVFLMFVILPLTATDYLNTVMVP